MLYARFEHCSDYCTSTIRLLRAVGIPARIETGNVFRLTNGSHAWIFAYNVPILRKSSYLKVNLNQ
ncbi:transglutaminase-like domain-containing protein [Lutispora thermophila]|uniref:transglutaminase-like domain-containing protein n=1 Tax=Lutispora thermophila TaxID=288966 RepID=UPI000A06B893